MSIELKKLTAKLHQNCLDLQSEQEGKLNHLVNLGNAYVELVTLYITQYLKDDNSILTTVTDEFFVDIHVSVTLAVGGYYKSGSVTLRAAMELGLYILYFIDHPIELKMWASSGEKERENDMSFSKILDIIANDSYLSAASGNAVDSKTVSFAKSQLNNTYRQLSERVHGKFKFLQASSSESDDIFTNFCLEAEEALRNLLRLGMERGENHSNLIKAIPSLERLI